MRARTFASRSGIASSNLLGKALQNVLRRGGVRTAGRQLQVRFELGLRARKITLVHQRHTELIVRFGVIRLGRDGRLELLFRVGDLSRVPEDLALVVEWVGVAAYGRAL